MLDVRVLVFFTFIQKLKALVQISLRFLPISKTKATNKCCKFLKCTCLGLQKVIEYISISISELASEVKSTETLKSWTSYKQSGSVFYIAWQYFGNALQLFCIVWRLDD